MILLKLITISFIVRTTSALGENGKNENNMCTIERIIKSDDGTPIIEPVEDCCEGYIPISADKCIPRCLDCLFGSCTKPDVCVCHKGYRKQDTRCMPICDFKCVNGFCKKPGICGCIRGFELDSKNSTTCVPQCNPKCPKYATCVKPNFCQCDTGYKENKTTKKCEPICPNMPKNAQCMEPSIWECNPNFRHDLRINKCILKMCSCHDKGYCLEYANKCECYEGFKKNTTTGQCVSVCEPQCVNATCIANNNCQCLDGYHVTPNAHICEINGQCNKQSCENGECLSTNECQCKPGYIRSITLNGEECVLDTIFMSQLMTMIVGIPIILAICILLIYYCFARRKRYNGQPDRELRLLSDMH